jgi:hypothetical protein
VTKRIGITVALASTLAWPGSAAAAKDSLSCALSPPVLRVRGQNWYADAAGSVVNKAAVERHQLLIRPLRNYATELTSALDRSDFDCTRRQLRHWANSGALLDQPTNFAGQRERLRFATAIGFAALRLRAQRGSLDASVKEWLRKLGSATAKDFENRGVTDNLFVWSGMNSALAWKLTGDPELGRSAKGVLARSTAQIRRDGLIASELRRETRSLLYHSYYLSGLLLLTAVLPGSGKDDDAIRRLAKRVAAGTCAPGAFPGGQPQAAPNQNDLVTIAHLGTAFGGKRPCGLLNMRLYDPLRGGRVQTGLDLLRGRGRP